MIKYFITLIIAIILFSGFLVYQGIYLPVDSNSDQTVIFLVKKGQGAEEISNNLKEQGLIKYSSFFRIYASINDQADKLKAGKYELSFSMNLPKILEKISSGDRIIKTITIIEGWNLKDIEEYLREEGIVVNESLDSELEGYLFPDTYEVSPEDGIKEIIEMMLANFDKKIKAEYQVGLNPEKLIMASLIEKEVRTIEDKKIVSGILWKRMEVGMPLQVDATINYITSKNTTKILQEELEIDSLYNTYKYKGLPPGPICNPGLESILAAINPQESEYWFYISTSEGETIFSKTLKEHNIAIAKYL